MAYQPVIGLEVHVELKTKSKLFCGCPAEHFGAKPNTQTCPVCLGLPGALPVPNKKAVEWTILLGLALNSKINKESKFDRKNYFYPDLPKGYQISQYDQPLCVGGKLENIRLRRVHLEEDTGKLQHLDDMTLVDFNRSGVPLVEVVTEPDFRNVEEVDVFLKKLQQIIRYLGISNADMEKGSMRIEPSVSILPISNTTNIKYPIEEKKLPNYRVELKNINSFKFAKRAIEYEIERQTEMLERGEQPTQQTRGFVESKGITAVQREKEEAHDYRYFPEPDIPPMRWTASQISELRTQIPELPGEKKDRFMKEYSLNDYDAGLLIETRERADYFEKSLKRQKEKGKSDEVTSKTIANWIINKKVDITSVTPEELLKQISQKAGGGATISDEELEKVIKQVLAESPKAVEDYKKGKEQALMFLVGQSMRKTQGKYSAEGVKKRIVELLNDKNL
ncbi:Asp-tRNA(Asn)/Glu-tRNA(Gln) amidotransferase subunit GatB [Candidatus Gottesmanbacteria bacterium]|nr:Asp-tRNA(Asn)/Glu-tRNA(Gln) amidotransferase subunit GatB [Candidatus Gottesmanbacteria bacterium]